jgi:heat shock protein HslJ
MKKTLLFVSITFLLVVATVLVFNPNNDPEEDGQVVTTDYKNATYLIDDTAVTLVDGVARKQLAVGASSVVTRYFGNELRKDLNDDGRDDVVFLLTQETGGSGTYFYVVAALNTENGYVGSHALLLGDRIAPQTTESGPGKQILVNYAERGVNEPMTAPPTMGKSRRLILDSESMQWGEVAADFAGEADPDRMTLSMQTWVWQSAEYNDGHTAVPAKPGVFTLAFSHDGAVAVGTDCNSVGGDYVADENQLAFTNLRTTLMYCEGSQEAGFIQFLEDTTSYHFTNRGELILELADDSGTVTFR